MTTLPPPDRVMPGSRLTRQEYERLLLIADEATKLASAALRCTMRGYDSPSGIRGVSGALELQARIGRIQSVIDLMCSKGDVKDVVIDKYQGMMDKEIPKITKWQT